MGQDNVLYCKVKSPAFPARFNRAAYYQLAEYIEEEGETYYLPLNGKKLNIDYMNIQIKQIIYTSSVTGVTISISAFFFRLSSQT